MKKSTRILLILSLVFAVCGAAFGIVSACAGFQTADFQEAYKKRRASNCFAEAVERGYTQGSRASAVLRYGFFQQLYRNRYSGARCCRCGLCDHSDRIRGMACVGLRASCFLFLQTGWKYA